MQGFYPENRAIIVGCFSDNGVARYGLKLEFPCDDYDKVTKYFIWDEDDNLRSIKTVRYKDSRVMIDIFDAQTNKSVVQSSTSIENYEKELGASRANEAVLPKELIKKYIHKGVINEMREKVRENGMDGIKIMNLDYVEDSAFQKFFKDYLGKPLKGLFGLFRPKKCASS